MASDFEWAENVCYYKGAKIAFLRVAQRNWAAVEIWVHVCFSDGRARLSRELAYYQGIYLQVSDAKARVESIYTQALFNEVEAALMVAKS